MDIGSLCLFPNFHRFKESNNKQNSDKFLDERIFTFQVFSYTYFLTILCKIYTDLYFSGWLLKASANEDKFLKFSHLELNYSVSYKDL